MSNQTEKMRVDEKHIAFLVDRMGRDCGPLQPIRELTENCLQAIERLTSIGSSDETQVAWVVDEHYWKENGVLKLCVVDTGCGMTGTEMSQFINQLSSSGGTQSLSDNYGIGAKISALTRNPYGLLYRSWKSADDEGVMALLWKDPETGHYGFRRFEDEDGNFSTFLPPAPETKHKLIQKAGHGTMVTLLGGSKDQDTFSAPESNDGGVKWVTKYLGERYFRFPDRVEVRATDKENYGTSGVDPQKRQWGFLRPVHPREEVLNANSQDSGVVSLDEADIRWWILNPDSPIKGSCSALYQDELYEVTKPGNESRAKLQQFGATFGFSRVVILVEPHVNDQLTTNTARTSLLINGERLPWEGLAQQFRDRLPQEITALEEELSSKSIGGHEKSIMERLKKLIDSGLYCISRYCPKPNGGDYEITSVTKMGGNSHSGGGSGEKNEHQVRSTATGDGRGKIDFGIAARPGKTATKVPSKLIPHVVWVENVSDQGLEDRAAYYDKTSNSIFANSTFAVFKDLADHLKKNYTDVPGLMLWSETQSKRFLSKP